MKQNVAKGVCSLSKWDLYQDKEELPSAEKYSSMENAALESGEI